ncbi:hypothetical protein BCY84_10644 [Trypanosoma cruzi cruzi]|nr:hypothetical protein BCY84_10644 [Trypanosoma cruzi cruzi]
MLPCGGATATQRDAAMAYHQLIQQQQQQALMHRLYQNKPSAGDVPNDDNDSNGDVFQVVGDEMMAALGRRVIVNRTAVTDASGEAGRQMMDHRGRPCGAHCCNGIPQSRCVITPRITGKGNQRRKFIPWTMKGVEEIDAWSSSCSVCPTFGRSSPIMP